MDGNKTPNGDDDKSAQAQARPRVVDSHLQRDGSPLCPGCGRTLDFWACEALCHHCGLKFTCDE